ncbi:MAG: hypothetical protein AAGI01_03235 [Myxococcota bacterium]
MAGTQAKRYEVRALVVVVVIVVGLFGVLEPGDVRAAVQTPWTFFQTRDQGARGVWGPDEAWRMRAASIVATEGAYEATGEVRVLGPGDVMILSEHARAEREQVVARTREGTRPSMVRDGVRLSAATIVVDLGSGAIRLEDVR